jgi:cell wall-associated NlpC family hydrolase
VISLIRAGKTYDVSARIPERPSPGNTAKNLVWQASYRGKPGFIVESSAPVSQETARAALSQVTRKAFARKLVLEGGRRGARVAALAAATAAPSGGGKSQEQETTDNIGKQAASVARQGAGAGKDFILQRELRLTGLAARPGAEAGKDFTVRRKERLTGRNVQDAFTASGTKPVKASPISTRGASHTARETRKAVQVERLRRNAAKSAVKSAGRQAAKKASAVTAKAAASAVRSTASAAGKVTLTAAAAPLLIIIILVLLVVGVVIALLMTPFGFFVSDQADTAPQTAQGIMDGVSSEWNSDLQTTIAQYEAQGYIVDTDYNSDGSTIGASFNNWRDVLAVYITSRSYSGESTAVSLSDADYIAVKSLFGRMNPVDVQTREEYVVVTEYPDGTVTETVYENMADIPDDPDPDEDAVTSIETRKYADVNVVNLSYAAGAQEFSFNQNQTDWLTYSMSSEMYFWWDRINVHVSMASAQAGAGGIDVDLILNDLPYSGIGSQAVAIGLTRLGDPYLLGGDNPPGGSVDCSAFTRWTYGQLGISIGWTAADQAQTLVNAGKAIDPNTAMPGDLVFWSYPGKSRVKGRFMQIGHVAIYAGNGMMIEAAPSAGGVVYRSVSVQGVPCLWARPY